MFEEEAKKYLFKNYGNDHHFVDSDIIKGFKDGAELGYKKCKEEDKRKITNEEKIMFQQWIDMNGGKEGALYMTFSDEELEQIFLTSITSYKKYSESKTQWQCNNKHVCSDNGRGVPCYIYHGCSNCTYKTE